MKRRRTVSDNPADARLLKRLDNAIGAAKTYLDDQGWPGGESVTTHKAAWWPFFTREIWCERLIDRGGLTAWLTIHGDILVRYSAGTYGDSSNPVITEALWPGADAGLVEEITVALTRKAFAAVA